MNLERARPAEGDAAPVVAAPTRQIVALMRYPLRLAIVTRLLFEPASAGELAAELDAPVEAIRHQLRKLARSGLVERRGTTRRRGVSEYLYASDSRRNFIRPGELASLPRGLHDEGQVRLLTQMFRETIAAIDAGTFHGRDDFVLIRCPLPLDEPGWAEAGRRSDDLIDAILGVSRRASARVERTGAAASPAFATVLLFDAPAVPWPTPVVEDAAAREPRAAARRPPPEPIGMLSDPLRTKVLDALLIAPHSAREIADLLHLPLAKVRYELNALQRAAIVTVDARRARRGTVEHVYGCEMGRLFAGREEVSAADPRRLERFCRHAAGAVFREALESTRAGVFHDHEDFCLARIPMRLDDRGFAEVSSLIDAFLADLVDLRGRCLERLADTPTPRPAFSDLLFFEAAPRR